MNSNNPAVAGANPKRIFVFGLILFFLVYGFFSEFLGSGINHYPLKIKAFFTEDQVLGAFDCGNVNIYITSHDDVVAGNTFEQGTRSYIINKVDLHITINGRALKPIGDSGGYYSDELHQVYQLSRPQRIVTGYVTDRSELDAQLDALATNHKTLSDGPSETQLSGNQTTAQKRSWAIEFKKEALGVDELRDVAQCYVKHKQNIDHVINGTSIMAFVIIDEAVEKIARSKDYILFTCPQGSTITSRGYYLEMDGDINKKLGIITPYGTLLPWKGSSALYPSSERVYGADTCLNNDGMSLREYAQSFSTLLEVL